MERDVSKFQGVHLKDIPKIEDFFQLNIFFYDIDFVDGELIGELCRRSIQKFEKSVKLLHYNKTITLLLQQNQRIVQSLPVYYVWYILLKDGESGMTFGYL